MLLFIAIFLIGYGYYLLTHISPDTSEEVAAFLAMTGKVLILLGGAKIALFALFYKNRSAKQTLIGRLKERFRKKYVSRGVRR